MLTEIPIKDIKVGNRFRKDHGDLRGLAASIAKEGLLQPIGVTKDLELIFGERRLRAHKDVLKRKTILARILDISSILSGEYAENEIRKDFTASERVAIAKAIQNKFPERRGNPTIRQKIDELDGRTDDHASRKAGFGNRQTFRQASKVVENGTPKLIQSMDSGKVSIHAASILVDANPEDLDEILDLDERAILIAAKEIRSRQYQKRIEHQESVTPKPVERPKKERLKATTLINGDCVVELKIIPSASIDLILTDPPYPEVKRAYGVLTESKWHDLMRTVVIEGRRILKPSGSMVIVLQPTYEEVGRMRLWLWEFLVWAGKEWNLIQDVYWWAFNAMPLTGTNREQGLLRQSVKMCVWLGPQNCFRNQDNVLWLPSDYIFAESKANSANRTSKTNRNFGNGKFGNVAEERGGTTPFNLIPVLVGRMPKSYNTHPATTPYDLASWWVKYLLPENGVLLDPFAGGGTTLVAGLDYGASKVIGIEKEKKYLEIAKRWVGD